MHWASMGTHVLLYLYLLYASSCQAIYYVMHELAKRLERELNFEKWNLKSYSLSFANEQMWEMTILTTIAIFSTMTGCWNAVSVVWDLWTVHSAWIG